LKVPAPAARVGFPVADVLIKRGLAKRVDRALLPTEALLERFSGRLSSECGGVEKLRWIMTEQAIRLYRARKAEEVARGIAGEALPLGSEKEVEKVADAIKILLLEGLAEVDIPSQPGGQA